MAISKAPLLNSLRTEGGTFITFSSAINDLSMMIGDTDVRSVASKFALLKLPEWKNVVNEQHMYEDGANIGTPVVTTPNTIFPKLLQNYIENFIQYSEQARIDNDYDNISEVAFWKLLQRVGALQLVENGDVVIDGNTYMSYKEADDSTTYEHIIKYIGDINSINFVQKYGREYLEVFAHIPTTDGYLSKVQFIPKQIQHTHALIPNGGGGVETAGLEGYDMQQNLALYDNISNTYDVSSDLSLASIDFNYHTNNNIYKNQGNFEFNCVLLFYDTFDKTNESTRRTNLFGILLLEPFSNNAPFVIPTLKKYMPSEINSGNSHIIRFNLNLSTQTNQISTDVIINDYSTVSMHLYTDALSKMTDIGILYEGFTDKITKMEADIIQMQQYIFQLSNINNYIQQIIQNTNDIARIASSQAKQGDIRISNEDLFSLFNKTVNSYGTNSIVNNTIIMTHKALLPKLVDKNMIILQDEQGNNYQWNDLTQEWDSI